ncbi:hypothetical protein [Gorillibacterium sp. sgz5001074]|uniref:hypothetical protein n=1 Tax=Gorillibacterium sp. sgz5001074 TaxID=3446695 RepID=UPI003F66C2E5
MDIHGDELQIGWEGAVPYSQPESLFRLLRPMVARMSILRVGSQPVTSNTGMVMVTHLGDRKLRFKSHLSIPSFPPIVMGFELDDTDDTICFEGEIETRRPKHEEYEYTVRLHMSQRDERKLRRLSFTLAKETMRMLEDAASQYRRHVPGDEVGISGCHIKMLT